jgi:hypothetical protein
MKTSFYCSWIFCFFLLLGGISFMTLPVQAQKTWFELNTQSDYWLFERDANLGFALGGEKWGLQLTGAYGRDQLQLWDRGGTFLNRTTYTYDRRMARADAHLMWFLLGNHKDRPGTGIYVGFRTEHVFEWDRDPGYPERFQEIYGTELPVYLQEHPYAQVWVGPAHGVRLLFWNRLALDAGMGIRYGIMGFFREGGSDLGGWMTLRLGYRFTKP